MPARGAQRPSRSGGARAAIRFLSAVLTTSGILMLADAGLTLAWQEPVSAFIGWRAQGALEDELEAAEERFGAASDLSRGELERLADRYERQVGEGDAFGRIELSSLDRDYTVVQGTDTATLRKGPGHYPDTSIPGQPGTVAIAGHRTTYLAPFRNNDKLEPGDQIAVTMPYARFVYEVEDQRIVEPTEVSVTDDVGHPQLVLSACHPLYSAAERLIVFARLVSTEPA